MSQEYDIARLPEGQQRFLIELHHRARVVFGETLARHGKQPGLPSAVAMARVALLEHDLAPIMAAMEHRGSPVACNRGCAACCTIMVEITPDEALALVQQLDRTLDPAAAAAAKARAQEKRHRSSGLPPKARQALRLYCAVLDQNDGACMAHPVRPGACQGYLSLDRARCEADHFGGDVRILKPAAAGYIRDAVTSAQRIVLEAAGLSQQRIELTEGLLRAWQDPAMEANWLAGAPFWPPG